MHPQSSLLYNMVEREKERASEMKPCSVDQKIPEERSESVFVVAIHSR